MCLVKFQKAGVVKPLLENSCKCDFSLNSRLSEVCSLLLQQSHSICLSTQWWHGIFLQDASIDLERESIQVMNVCLSQGVVDIVHASLPSHGVSTIIANTLLLDFRVEDQLTAPVRPLHFVTQVGQQGDMFRSTWL